MGRLFERMLSGNVEPPRGRVKDIQESVSEHLKKLLNTRQGSVETNPDYGIPDLSEFIYSFPESITFMQSVLASAIEKFEPRLTSVRVTYREDKEDALYIKFDISARMIVKDAHAGISSCSFQTTVGPTGRVSIGGG